MQHLIGGDVVQHHGDRLRRIQSRWHGDELALDHARVLRIAAVDGHGGDRLTHFEASRAFTELIDGSDEIPSRRVRHARRFRMDSLPRQNVRQTDPSRQYLHPHLACFRGGDIFFDCGDYFRPTVVSDDNSHVAHVPDAFALASDSATSCTPAAIPATCRVSPKSVIWGQFAQAPRIRTEKRSWLPPSLGCSQGEVPDLHGTMTDPLTLALSDKAGRSEPRGSVNCRSACARARSRNRGWA